MIGEKFKSVWGYTQHNAHALLLYLRGVRLQGFEMPDDPGDIAYRFNANKYVILKNERCIVAVFQITEDVTLENCLRRLEREEWPAELNMPAPVIIMQARQ